MDGCSVSPVGLDAMRPDTHVPYSVWPREDHHIVPRSLPPQRRECGSFRGAAAKAAGFGSLRRYGRRLPRLNIGMTLSKGGPLRDGAQISQSEAQRLRRWVTKANPVYSVPMFVWGVWAFVWLSQWRGFAELSLLTASPRFLCGFS